jgi:hypothetical protein
LAIAGAGFVAVAAGALAADALVGTAAALAAAAADGFVGVAVGFAGATLGALAGVAAVFGGGAWPHSVPLARAAIIRLLVNFIRVPR